MHMASREASEDDIDLPEEEYEYETPETDSEYGSSSDEYYKDNFNGYIKDASI